MKSMDKIEFYHLIPAHERQGKSRKKIEGMIQHCWKCPDCLKFVSGRYIEAHKRNCTKIFSKDKEIRFTPKVVLKKK